MTTVAIVQATCTKKVKIMGSQDNQKASKHAGHDAEIGVRAATGNPRHMVALGRIVEGGKRGWASCTIGSGLAARSLCLRGVSRGCDGNRGKLAAGAESVLPSGNGCWMNTEECKIVGCVPRLRCRTTGTGKREGSVHPQSDNKLQDAERL